MTPCDTINTTPEAPPSPLQVWVGCLSCYNAGKLTGQWFQAVYAEDVTMDEVHAPGRPLAGCEELWCFDLDGFPVSREMSPSEATSWGLAYAAVPRDQWPAFSAWVEGGWYNTRDDSDAPDPQRFTECYLGAWDSFRDFCENYAADVDLQDGWPDIARNYFDWDAWVRDMAYLFTAVECEGVTHVFESN